LLDLQFIICHSKELLDPGRMIPSKVRLGDFEQNYEALILVGKTFCAATWD